jgi:ABC-type uncharacterized transport system substrate-binding protein
MVATRSQTAWWQVSTTPVATLLAQHLSRLLLPPSGRELVPNVATVGVLINPKNQLADTQLNDVHVAARTLGQPVYVVNAGNESEFETAFAALVRQGAGALLLGTDTTFFNHRDRLIALAARYGIPAIYTFREYVLDGGLISYGAIQTETVRQAGVYIGRILRGANPGDLPVVQPTKFELAINLTTAKALGLEIPAKLLALADEVIE